MPICKHCNKPYAYTASKPRKYCSRPCYYAAGRVKRNNFEIRGDVTCIFVEKDGVRHEVLIDTEDFPKVQSQSWHLNAAGYAIGSRTDRISLARLVTSAPGDMYVDHFNHNKCDNRKSQLRLVNNSANSANRSTARNVVHYKNARKWAVRFTENNKALTFGYFDTESEALDVAARIRSDRKLASLRNHPTLL